MTQDRGPAEGPSANGEPRSPWARPDDTPPIELPAVRLSGAPHPGSPKQLAQLPQSQHSAMPGGQSGAPGGPRYLSGPGYAGGSPAAYLAPPPADARWTAARVDPVPGTAFGLVQLEIPTVASGMAMGSLIVGIAALLVALLVGCFGLAGAQDGWGLWVAGAFSLLAGLAGIAAIGLGVAGRRQIRGSGEPGRMRFTGRGLAISGVACGGVGLAIVVLGLVLVSLVQFT